MDILIVDNGTEHLSELEKILSQHNVSVISKEKLNATVVEKHDLLILSGSIQSPVMEKPEIYAKEIAIIQNSTKPIIGICMGFEIIAYAFGAELRELPFKEESLMEIKVVNNDSIFTQDTYKVEERHRWVVTSVVKPLVAIATSKDGIEAIKHEGKNIYGFQFHPEIFDNNNEGAEIFVKLLEKLSPVNTI